MRQIRHLTEELLLAWIWIEHVGWLAGAISAEGLFFEERPPEVQEGAMVVAYERQEGESSPPDEEETAEIMREVAAAELRLRAPWN